MVAPNYWIDLFSAETWQEFVAAGARTTGFRERRWSMLTQVRPGDFFLCYLTGVSRFVGLLEAEGEPFNDAVTRIWSREDFPCRIAVRPLVLLEIETAVPVAGLLSQLSIYDAAHPNVWTGFVRGSPTQWTDQDGELVAEAISSAGVNPVNRPVDPTKLKRKPKTPTTARSKRLGTVSIPEADESEITRIAEGIAAIQPGAEAPEASAHTEIQWRLLNLGSQMGLDVWVARNDRNREFQGNRFSELPTLRSELPRQFDEATNSTIELIDVLWLQKQAIVAAFEIESTTSIYSGLLRMSDLLAMQPNINIPLYLVAPDERKDKVRSEITRPTFSRLSPPLRSVCRYVPFSALRDKLPAANVIPYLSPDYVNKELSVSFDTQ